MNKILIVFYTRSGRTRIAVDMLAQELAALAQENIVTVEELEEQVNRKGLGGFIKAALDARNKKITPLSPVQNDPSEADLTIIVSPVWAGTMCTAVRTYIIQQKDKLNKVAFISTQGSKEQQGIFTDLQELVDKKPLSTCYLTNNDYKENQRIKVKLHQFINEIKKQ